MKKIICLCLCVLMMTALPLSASAMPRQGEYSAVNASNNAVITSDNNTMYIGSNGPSNIVLRFRTFDLYHNETVFFDQGTQKNSYLILIDDTSPSFINGNISGGRNIYIINPNGVLFGNSSNVNVGNLYVSTRPLENSDTNAFLNGNDPLSMPAGALNADIINVGTVEAGSVFYEGADVILEDSISRRNPR